MSNTWKVYMLTFITFLLGTAQFVIVGILDKSRCFRRRFRIGSGTAYYRIRARQRDRHARCHGGNGEGGAA